MNNTMKLYLPQMFKNIKNNMCEAFGYDYPK